MTVVNTALIIGVIIFIAVERWKEKVEEKRFSKKIIDLNTSMRPDEDGVVNIEYPAR